MGVCYEIKMLVYILIAGITLILVYNLIASGKKSILLFSHAAFRTFIIVWALYNIIFETYFVMGSRLKQEKIYLLNVAEFLEHFVTCFIIYSWLIFCILYTNSKFDRKKFTLILLGLPPVIFFIIHITGYFDTVYYSGIYDHHKIVYFIYMASCYLYLLAGEFLLIRNTLRQYGYIKMQGILLSICIVLPFIANVYQNYRVQFLHTSYYVFGIDITLVSFAITTFIMAFADFRFKFLNAIPYAMKDMFINMDHPIVLSDDNGRIIDFNASFIAYFSGILNIKRNDSIESLYEQLGMLDGDIIKYLSMSGPDLQKGKLEFELKLDLQENRFFRLNIRPIYANEKNFVGSSIVFTDITNLKNAINELNQKNDELQDYSRVVEALAVERERNRFARDVHDTFGQYMTVLNTMIKGCIISCDKDITLTKEKLRSAAEITKEGLKELRMAVTGLSTLKFEQNGMKYKLVNMIKNFKASGFAVELSLDIDIDSLTVEYFTFIFRLCQEALTNSVRHGMASNCSIVLQYLHGRLRLFISDNGCGCTKINKGMGLTGMEQRTKELNGKIQYGTSGERGFNIYVEVPYSYDCALQEAVKLD